MFASKGEARTFSKNYIHSLNASEMENSRSRVLGNTIHFLESQFPKPRRVQKLAGYRADQWEISIFDLETYFPEYIFYYPKVVSDTVFQLQKGSSWVKGSFGIWEPDSGETLSDWGELSLVFLPGLGFHKNGHRLGRGKGYYDRMLEGMDRRKLVGICYSNCSGYDFPYESHDISVGYLITEKEIIHFLD